MEFTASSTSVSAKPLAQVAILDFGSQYSHLIARRVRELHVYCELHSCLITAEALTGTVAGVGRSISGIILSGGPSSVYDKDSPHLHSSVWEYIEKNSIPVLGICYGMQEMAQHFGGVVSPSPEREFGRAVLSLLADESIKTHPQAKTNDLFHEVDVSSTGDELTMWMSHGDKVSVLPPGFVKVAATANSDHAAIADISRRMYGLQFHPEVTHSGSAGRTLLRNFVVNICGASATWNMSNIADKFIQQVRDRVGEESHVIGAVSGGVDSSVAAVLLQKAVGNRFHAIMVDNGCLRKNEAELVVERLKNSSLNINLTVVPAADRFLDALEGVVDPEVKRKTIGRIFIEIFQEEAKKIGGKVDFLLQGTLYPDVIESVSYKGPSATIKTHHNVGGLPASMHLQLVEPLRELFKDEVRDLGVALGIDPESVWRHPFPGPGLAIRVLGEITRSRLSILREADDILLQEIRNAGIYNDIGQAFVVLLPVKSVGVMGDCRTYEQACAIRCVASSDFMTADWYHMDYALLGKIANRIINEVKGINRVCYDVSSKPPATIEWE